MYGGGGKILTQRPRLQKCNEKEELILNEIQTKVVKRMIVENGTYPEF